MVVAAGAIAIKVLGHEAGQRAGAASRALLFLASALVFVFALLNPGKERFRVTRATVFADPARYRGRCPASVRLVGTIHATGGMAKVRSDLYLSFIGGRDERERDMRNGQSVERRISLRRTSRGNASFVVLAPNRLAAAFPVRYVCTQRRSHRRARRDGQR